MCRLSEPHAPPVSSLDAWRAFVQALREWGGGLSAAYRRFPSTLSSSGSTRGPTVRGCTSEEARLRLDQLDLARLSSRN